MSERVTRICFVRHGETDWNSELRLQGQIDLALNASGESQAAALGPWFLGRTAAAIYSSDLLRARQTAQPISDSLRLPIVALPALRERHFGRCEGLTMAEIADRYADDAQAIESNDPDYVLPENGESRRQFNARILRCVEELIRTHRGETIIVVTHGGALDVIYRCANNLPVDAPRNYPIPNTGLNWLAIGDEQWRIESWGSTQHLTMEDKSSPG